MAIHTPGLNRWHRMQQQPIGDIATPMGGMDEGQKTYNAIRNAYATSQRLLRRASRRGSNLQRAQAAQLLARSLQESSALGISGTTGIRDGEQQRAAAQGYSRALAQNALAAEEMNRRERESLGIGTATIGSSGRLGATQAPRLGDTRQSTNPTTTMGTGVADEIEDRRVGETPAPRLGNAPMRLTNAGSTQSFDTSGIDTSGIDTSGIDTSGIDMEGEIVNRAFGPLAQARRGFARQLKTGDITKDEAMKEARRLGVSNSALSGFLDRSGIRISDRSSQKR